ncbi:MAG: type II toxin-antitoxin system RelE/ParE family toxin [Sphingomicrobium sp.]|jgi:plasmid stabilization system protein ParE
MRVEITAEAERDLREIFSYIAKADTRRARSFLRELRAACEGLAEFPDRFAFVPRYERLGIRHRVHGNYLIFYRAERVRVVVIHVLHGARDFTGLLDAL